jgi:hypothetical protein
MQPFGATNEKDTCLWCGRKLRMQYITEYERVVLEGKPPRRCHCGSKRFKPIENPSGGLRWECASDSCCAWHSDRGERKVVSRTPRYKGRGDYGDGHFCGLTCGYEFAVKAANDGIRLVTPKTRKAG